MRKYETVFISNPDLQDQNRTDLFEKFRNLVEKQGGIPLDFDEWGNRKLAYEIGKKSRGYYVCMTYGGNAGVVSELERILRLDANVMKFMTILKEKDLTPEQLEKEKEEEVAADGVSE